jgi:hypothetical protein
MSLNQVIATIILSVIASLIYFFIERGVLDSYFFRDEAKSAAEQAKIDAFKAEVVRQQEAADKAKAEAEADRLRREALEEENRTKQKQLEEESRRAQIQADIEAQQARQRASEQAEEEALAHRRQLQAEAQAAAEEQARRRRAYRDANGGCDLGTHRVCVHIGPSGGGPGGYNAGCFCQSD